MPLKQFLKLLNSWKPQMRTKWKHHKISISWSKHTGGALERNSEGQSLCAGNVVWWVDGTHLYFKVLLTKEARSAMKRWREFAGNKAQWCVYYTGKGWSSSSWDYIQGYLREEQAIKILWSRKMIDLWMVLRYTGQKIIIQKMDVCMRRRGWGTIATCSLKAMNAEEAESFWTVSDSPSKVLFLGQLL